MRSWLKEARKNKGLSQVKVADMLGISRQQYSFIENGTRQKK